MADSSAPAAQPDFFSTQVQSARRFYLDLSIQRSSTLTVVCGGREVCLPDYYIDRADFPYFSLEFVSRGRGHLLLGKEHTELTPGVAYTYGPRTPHRIESSVDEPLEKYFVDFTGIHVGKFLDEIALQPGAVRMVHAPIEVQRAFDDLIVHGARSGGTTSQLCNTLMQYILLLVSLNAVSATTGQSLAHSTYLRCRNSIEQSYLTLHNLDEAARETRVDKTYLCRLFQRFDNQTPYEYLTRLKMNKAAELLDNSDVLIKQVAAYVGFSDPFHFSRVFKNVFGVSPREFRSLRSQGIKDRE